MDTMPLPRPCDPLDGSLPEMGDSPPVPGGPVHQLIRRAHPDEHATSHTRRRIIVIRGIVMRFLERKPAPFASLVFTMIPLDGPLDTMTNPSSDCF